MSLLELMVTMFLTAVILGVAGTLLQSMFNLTRQPLDRGWEEMESCFYAIEGELQGALQVTVTATTLDARLAGIEQSARYPSLPLAATWQHDQLAKTIKYRWTSGNVVRTILDHNGTQLQDAVLVRCDRISFQQPDSARLSVEMQRDRTLFKGTVYLWAR